jgi:hypothetical protein
MGRAQFTESPTRQPRQQAIACEEIAKAAYRLFEQRGRTHGRDLDDWLEAERILNRQARAVSPSASW